MKRVLFAGCMLLLVLGAMHVVPVAAEGTPGVVLEYIGHSCFLLTSPGGASVLMDPYFYSPGGLRPMPTDLAPSAVTVSHDHADHDYVACVPATTAVLRTAGTYAVGDITVTGYAWREGSPFGPYGIPNVIFVFEVAGTKIVHLGDSGLVTDPAILQAISDADVVIVNIDGYVIPSTKILPFMNETRARTVIIAHYTVRASIPFGSAPTVEQFFARLPESVVRVASAESTLVVTPGMPTQILAMTPSTLIK
ncbi:MAG: MBL fold metallo-hydrolase [Thermotogota bacterium]